MSSTLGDRVNGVNGTGKKIVAKFSEVVAASGLIFALSVNFPSALPVSAVALAEPQAPHSDCRPPSLANCYYETTMKDYRDRVLPSIAGFFKARYKTVPEEPSDNRFIDRNEKPSSACGDLNDRTLAYCREDQRVYLGQEIMWELYDKVGDIAPAVALAHEWGHNIQLRKGVSKPTNKDEKVKYEQQADCVAGAWIQYVGERGWLEPEDPRTIDRLIEYLAEAEPSDGDHGPPEKRREAMLLGNRGGLSECNRFNPSTPIFTSQG